MSMNENIQLDSSRVTVRGRGSVMAGGVGGLGIIGAIVYFLLTGNVPDAQNFGSSQGQQRPAADASQLLENCTTGADANASTECWMVATAESLDAYWGQAQ